MDENPKDEPAGENPVDEILVTEINPPVNPGWAVMFGAEVLGVYPTEADAEAFADGHPRAHGLTVEVREVK